MITSTRDRETGMNASHVIGLLFLGLAIATLFSREPLASIPVDQFNPVGDNRHFAPSIWAGHFLRVV